MPVWIWLPLLLLLIFAVVVVVLPLSASFAGELGSEKIQATVEGYWGAKALISLFFSTDCDIPEFRILGRRFGGPPKDKSDGYSTGSDDSEYSFEADSDSSGEKSPTPPAEECSDRKDEFLEAPKLEETGPERLSPEYDNEFENFEEYVDDSELNPLDRAAELPAEDKRNGEQDSGDIPFGREKQSETNQSDEPRKRKPGLFERLRKSPVVFFLRQHRYQMRVMQWLKRVIVTVFRIVRFDKFTVVIRGGIGDPVVTGILYGTLTSIKQALQTGIGRPHSLEYEPDFDTVPSLTGSAAIKLHTSLFRVFLPLIVALLTFPYLSTILLWLRVRKLKKSSVPSGETSSA